MPKKPLKRQSRIQLARRQTILDAALDVFSTHGLKGATLDQIANLSGLSKPNILYYYKSKEDIYEELVTSLLTSWMTPLMEISQDGEPFDEILGYVSKKLEMSRTMPQESKLFATEILLGAPMLRPFLSKDLRVLVDQKAEIIQNWGREGKIALVDAHHLIFSIWSLTQHYADFDVQVRAILKGRKDKDIFQEAEAHLHQMFTALLKPE
jgi:TetR/AcrR family transcriptional regulator